MLPFLSQPALAPACYVPKYKPVGSLLFDGVDNCLTFTPAVNGNRMKSCVDTFVHMQVGQETIIWFADRNNGGGNNDTDALLISSGMLYGYFGTAGTGADTVYGFNSAATVFRSSGFYHIRSILDTAQDTPSERFKVVVNGQVIPLTWWDKGVVPQNYVPRSWNNAGIQHRLGQSYPGAFLPALLCEWIWTDGFIPPVRWEVNIHGVLVPTAPGLALADYGTNGCFLDFSAPLQPGKDVSGKGNHWAASGFDAAGKDTVASTPTNVFATWNSLVPGAVTLSNSGITAYYNASGANSLAATSLSARSGKYRAQVTIDTANMYVGVCTSLSTDSAPGAQTPSVWYRSNSGQQRVNGVESAYGAPYASGDIITIDLDLDGQTVIFSKNGVSQGAIALPASGHPWVIACSQNGLSVWKATINCGQSSGYVASPVYLPLCTANLPEPDIKDPAEAFANEVGTGANLTALLDASSTHWNGAAYVEIIKRRDVAESWRWRFSDDAGQAIASNNANAKAVAPSLAAGGAYVGYRLRVGKPYGVWTAEVVHVTGTATTVTHGLATARTVVIAKRVSAGGGDWYLRHPDMAAGYLLWLNKVVSAASDGTITAFGADSFQIGAAAPSGTYRVLVMAERPGYLALAKHTGNGSADGAFCPLDISPQWLLIGKSTVGAGWAWQVRDAVRAPVNADTAELRANTSDPELSASPEIIDKVVGGYKTRTANGSTNEAGCTYYTVSIGRPIGGVCVAPATAR